MRITVALIASLLFLPSTHAADSTDAATVAQLIRQTQELYDAVVPGNTEPWKKYYADDCIFADEKGRLFDKAKLVADITPLPAGYSGATTVGKSLPARPTVTMKIQPLLSRLNSSILNTQLPTKSAPTNSRLGKPES